MKNKTKLAVLGLALSCSVAGMIGATTFAWFSARTSMTTNFASITVNARNASLSVTVHPLGGVNLNGSSDPIEMSSVSQNFTGDFSIHDATSDYGEYFIRFANNQYTRIAPNDVHNYVAMVGIEVSNLAIGHTGSISVCPFWRAHNSSDSADVEAAKNMRFCALQCTDDTFSTITTNAVRHAFIYDDSTDPLNYRTYNPSTSQVVTGTYEEDDYSVMDDVWPLTDILDAATNYYRIAFWFDGSISNDQDAARGGQVDLIVTFSAD